jgi:hypothetical protein
LAATRFDARKGFVLEEANAIGTTYLRAAPLTVSQQALLDLRDSIRHDNL